MFFNFCKQFKTERTRYDNLGIARLKYLSTVTFSQGNCQPQKTRRSNIQLLSFAAATSCCCFQLFWCCRTPQTKTIFGASVQGDPGGTQGCENLQAPFWS